MLKDFGPTNIIGYLKESRIKKYHMDGSAIFPRITLSCAKNRQAWHIDIFNVMIMEELGVLRDHPSENNRHCLVN